MILLLTGDLGKAVSDLVTVMTVEEPSTSSSDDKSQTQSKNIDK